MKNKLQYLLFVLFITNSVYGQDAQEIKYRILFIGDAGEPSLEEQEPVLKALQERAKLLPELTSVIFLGDNIYPAGLPDSNDTDRLLYQSKIDAQIDVVANSGAQGYFIPGNHDWDQGKPGGWQRLKNQVDYVLGKGLDNLSYFPQNTCPGPEHIDIGSSLRIIFLDTQWWLQDDEKPVAENSDCPFVTEPDILYELDNLISNAEGRQIIIAAHHPLETYGPHGGHYTWKDHIFPLRIFNSSLWIPLPIIGSLLPLARSLGATPQDLSNSSYMNMAESLEVVVSRYKNIIYISGHEHVLQVLKGKGINNFYLISGSGTSDHNEEVGCGESTLFADDYPGFMQLDILEDASVVLTVFGIDENTDNISAVFSLQLK